MGSLEESVAKCPYWRIGTKDTVNCEGLIKMQTHSFRFQKLQDRKNWGEKYCCGQWKTCPWAKVLNSKYE